VLAPTDQPTAELVDPVASASAAGLHYVTDAAPGIHRRRAGKGWTYTAPDGSRVRDAATLGRIKSLAIPPAWTDVWICPDRRGHLQATGRDARRRKQYRYHPDWRAVRDAVKYDRMVAFAEALPRIRARVDADLARPGLPRERVLATVVRLLEDTLIRVGNDEYRRQNRSFGLTTLRDRHVDVHGTTIRFHFRGKHGIVHDVKVTDRRLARIVRRCRDIPGQELFQFVDDGGGRHSIGSADVNAYLHEISGEDFTAKDFRTWAGTVLAARFFRTADPASSKTETQRQVVRTIERVAEQLGNTVAVCRKCYVHPAVVEAYLAGSLAALEVAREQVEAFAVQSRPPEAVDEASSPTAHERAPHGLSEEEGSVLQLLRQSAAPG
jgi:DNA topoisomerase-1